MPQLHDAARGPRTTFDDLEHSVHEDIIAITNDPAMISAQVTELLSGLDHEDSFVVHRVAKDLAEAIAHERAFKYSDMVSVIRTLSAAVEPMIAWLERHGFNVRSLRHIKSKKFPRGPGNNLPASRPHDGTRAPSGEFSYGEVRAIVREAVMELGPEPVRKILDHEGNGATNVSQLKPKYLDIVYEACLSLLALKSLSALEKPGG
jgi:hypothetical protein